MSTNAQTPRFLYPEVPKRPVECVYPTVDGALHITDNYGWLHDFDGDPEVRRVIAEQNTYTQQYFDALGTLPYLEQEFADLTFRSTSFSLSRVEGGYELFSKLSSGDEFHTIMARKDGKEHVLIDPNAMGEGIDVKWYKMSPTGGHLVYAVQHGDRGEPTVFIRDMESGQEDQFYSGTACDIDFDPDGSGFAYITCEGKKYDIKKRYQYQRISYHRFDESIEQGTLLLDAAESGLGNEVALAIEHAQDGRTLLFGVWHGREKTDWYLLDKQTRQRSQLIPELEGQHNAAVWGESVYIITKGKQDRDRMVACAIDQAASTPLGEWDEVIAKREGQEIKDVQATKSNFVAVFSDGVSAQVSLFNRQTRQEQPLPMPPNTSIQATNIKPESDSFDYAVGNVLLRKKVYTWNGSDSREIFDAHHNLPLGDYETALESFVSFEGKEIPLLLAAAKGVMRQKDAAVMMECYGGFFASTLPHKRFTNYCRQWMEHGQIMAFPFLSGDGSTRQNYEDGIKQYKYRVVDEINAAALYLHRSGLTNRLGLTGGSNGGLMIMAAALKQPQWYKALDVRVPLSNMFEFHNWLDGAEWIREYGDPRKPEQLSWLQKYSAYHLVEPSQEQLPAMLISAGLNDTGVHPAHAIWMAAKRQARQPNALTLLNINSNTGHGYGMSSSQWHHYYAQRLGFMLHELGVESSGRTPATS